MEAGAQKRGPSEGVDFRVGSPQSLQPPAARPTIGTPASAARSRTQLCLGIAGHCGHCSHRGVLGCPAVDSQGSECRSFPPAFAGVEGVGPGFSVVTLQ